MARKNESPFVSILEKKIHNILPKNLRITRGLRLNYQSGFTGPSVFETDLCILQGDIPRVVLELKTSPTTHDVMVYSQKANDHKRLAPQLVYGMISENYEVVRTKLSKHNRHMDFALCLGGLSNAKLGKILRSCIIAYTKESRLREQIASGNYTPRGFFRKTICQ